MRGLRVFGLVLLVRTAAAAVDKGEGGGGLKGKRRGWLEVGMKDLWRREGTWWVVVVEKVSMVETKEEEKKEGEEIEVYWPLESGCMGLDCFSVDD